MATPENLPLDGPSEPAGAGNVPEFTVSELSAGVKRTIERAYDHVRVRGEIGRVSRPASGHVYLDLKDEKAVIAGVVWKGVAGKLAVQPEQGLEVIATGRLTTFPGQSKYQIVIEAIEPAGVGALMALLEERKKKLAAEGLFDDARKKPVPLLPDLIGIVTSPSGAVIRDILHGFDERFPARVVVWPVRVQGETSAREVAQAITGFNRFPERGDRNALRRPDVLIVARGGGSLEDLWGFNEEIVARAVAQSEIPVISAVGHETDWTLIDLVADARAPTPTKAAEWAVPKYSDLMGRLAELDQRLRLALRRGHEERRQRFLAVARGLPRLQDLLALPRQRFDVAASGLNRALIVNTQHHTHRFAQTTARFHPRLIAEKIRRHRERHATFEFRLHQALTTAARFQRGRLQQATLRLRPTALQDRLMFARRVLAGTDARRARALTNNVTAWRRHLDAQSTLLTSLSYQGVLARGYALVRDADGATVASAATLAPDQPISIEFTDGRIGANVTTGPAATRTTPGKIRSTQRPGKSWPRRDKKLPRDDQGDLF